MDFLAIIQKEFDYTIATDPFFNNRESNTLVAEIYDNLQYKKQELCESIYKELSEVVNKLPYPLTSEMYEVLGLLRQMIRSSTKLDELNFRMFNQAASRVLSRIQE